MACMNPCLRLTKLILEALICLSWNQARAAGRVRDRYLDTGARCRTREHATIPLRPRTTTHRLQGI